MFEKRLAVVAPQLFTVDGTTDGTITIATDPCALFKVKQRITIAATGLPDLSLEIKEIANGVIKVGPFASAARPAGPTTPNKPAVQSSLLLRTDISAYTVALGANIFADEQRRAAIDGAEIARATYEEEPAVAIRSILVDDCGDKYNATNPLPVAFDGTVTVGDVSIVEGGNTMVVNPDGSINVNITTSSSDPGLVIFHNEITAVASGVEATILTLVAPPTGYRVQKVEVSGDNTAIFRVKLNGATLVDKRTWWCNFNETFNFENFVNGLLLTSGQTLTVTAMHNRPFVGGFEATVMYLN